MAASILQTGVYTITNKYFHNGVFLRANDESKTLRAKASSDDDCSKWTINERADGRYTIQNVETKQYAYVSPAPALNTQVVARSSDCEWRIAGTGEPGVYTIAPADQDYFWGLPYPDAETPIQLCTGNTDDSNQWTIELSAVQAQAAASRTTSAVVAPTAAAVQAQQDHATPEAPPPYQDGPLPPDESGSVQRPQGDLAHLEAGSADQRHASDPKEEDHTLRPEPQGLATEDGGGGRRRCCRWWPFG